MKGVWSFPTQVRLAVARGALWCAWHFALGVMIVCCRPDHPTRVYVTGGRHTVLRSQMAALRCSTGPRYEHAPLPVLLGVMITLLSMGLAFA